MNDRIHAYLDGELPREALTRDELAQVTAFERELEGFTGAVRAAPVPDFASSVMRELAVRGALEKPGSPTWAVRLRQWFWWPRTVTFQWRPAYALAGACGLVFLMLSLDSGAGGGGGSLEPPQASAAPPASLYVQFRLEAPEAQSVQLAGSFTGWTPEHELVQTAPGVWSALVPLEPGVHDYTFVIDGQRMVVDPYAPQVADDFGGSNSRLFLPAPVLGT